MSRSLALAGCPLETNTRYAPYRAGERSRAGEEPANAHPDRAGDGHGEADARAGTHILGRRLLLIDDGSALSSFLARPHDRVLLDLGCGDARATARLAAREPNSLVIGIDANLDAAARVLRRTRRSLEKGGLPNLALVRAAADRLPAELTGEVDELRIELPWGSLSEGLLAGDPALLSGIARVLASGAQLRVVLNARALPHELRPETAADRLGRALESAGLSDVRVDSTAVWPETGWGKRLASGRPLEVVVAEAGKPSP